MNSVLIFSGLRWNLLCVEKFVRNDRVDIMLLRMKKIVTTESQIVKKTHTCTYFINDL